MRPKDLAIVRAILAALPQGAKAWVFGSRPRGEARRASDLDLAIDAGRPLKRAESVELASALEESDLPYRVDVADMHALGAAFRQRVEGERIALP